MIKTIVESQYKLKVLNYEKLSVGAGSNTYIIYTDQGKYILKNPNLNDINNPNLEPDLCEFLLRKGIRVSEFIKNIEGKYICEVSNNIFHLQKFINGINYELNTAPDWLMVESARLLGKIHTALEGYTLLPEGIGEGFFIFMTPHSAKKSYEATLKIAIMNKDNEIARDLEYRIELMERFPIASINIHDFTCKNTHGDYFVSQLICGDNKINAVIDWTTACVHPVSWEIIRSFVYAEYSCIDGEINIQRLITYIKEYLKFGKLSENDILFMPKLFFYQIAVCDYYNQYYQSSADNRNIYLHQAFFSTKLMKWFDVNLEGIEKQLSENF